MSWNYRVLRHDSDGQVWFGIHEVYYDEADKPRSWSAEPVCLFGESAKQLAADFVLMDEAFNRPLLIRDGDTLRELAPGGSG